MIKPQTHYSTPHADLQIYKISLHIGLIFNEEKEKRRITPQLSLVTRKLAKIPLQDSEHTWNGKRKKKKTYGLLPCSVFDQRNRVLPSIAAMSRVEFLLE